MSDSPVFIDETPKTIIEWERFAERYRRVFKVDPPKPAGVTKVTEKVQDRG